MIIVDTNIISELMKASPSTTMMSWLDQQDVTQLFTTTITIAEIAYGLNALPIGTRRTTLENNFNQAIKEAFANRILVFSEPAAHSYGKLMGYKKEAGQPLSILDGQIAAITLTHAATLATRNTRDFINCGINLIDPFTMITNPA
jgi:predicted nucleic acid-binding protein